jgi:hypothetical protein
MLGSASWHGELARALRPLRQPEPCSVLVFSSGRARSRLVAAVRASTTTKTATTRAKRTAEARRAEANREEPRREEAPARAPAAVEVKPAAAPARRPEATRASRPAERRARPPAGAVPRAGPASAVRVEAAGVGAQAAGAEAVRAVAAEAGARAQAARAVAVGWPARVAAALRVKRAVLPAAQPGRVAHPVKPSQIRLRNYSRLLRWGRCRRRR